MLEFDLEVKPMPLYEYKCEICGEVFETLVSLSKINDPVECVKCGSIETKKLFSSFSTSSSSKSISNSSCNTKGG